MRSFFSLFTMVLLVTTSAFSATTTAFTFQGQLTDPLNKPLTGSYDMTFELFADETGGVPVAEALV